MAAVTPPQATRPQGPPVRAVPAVRAVRAGGVSLPLGVRSLVVCALLAAGLVGAMLAALVYGEVQVGLPRVLLTVLGEGLPVEELIVQEIRLPRVIAVALVGLALGMAGAIFQTVSRNPLGSPDVMGFDTGAATGALVAMLVVGGGATATSVGAVAGGAATALGVYLLAMRHGVDGLRLVLVGVGAGALLMSVNSMLVVGANLYDAQSAAVWLVGNLGGRDWGRVVVLAPAVAVVAVAALLLSRQLRMSELNDDTAIGLGLCTERVRLLAVVVGVLLAGVAVAAAGPIAFIALTAPQVARRLTRASGANLLASGLAGALFLVLSDLAARELFQPRQVAVGVMTGLVGGLYLAWLLTREWRKGKA